MYKSVKQRMPIAKAIAIYIIFYPFFSSIITDKIGFTAWGHFDELAVAALVIFLLIEKKGKISFSKTNQKIYWSFLLWVIVGFLPYFTRKVSLSVLIQGAFLQLKNYIIFYLVYNIAWNDKDLNQIIRGLKNVYIVIIGLGVFFYFFPSFRIFHSDYMTSIFSHPGIFATLIVPVGIYAFVLYLNGKGNKYLFIMALTFGCLLLAGTIKNLVSIGFVCAIYLAYFKKSKKYIFLGLAAVALVAIAPQLYSLFEEEIVANILSDTAANRPRWMLWNTGFRIASDYFPIGSGFGTFGNSISSSINHYSDIYILYGINTRYGFEKGNALFLSDTYWPSVIGETGLIGSVIVIGLVALMLHSGYISVKNNMKQNSNLISVIIYLSFIAICIESLFTASFFGIRSYVSIILLAIICSFTKEADKAKRINYET